MVGDPEKKESVTGFAKIKVLWVGILIARIKKSLLLSKGISLEYQDT